MFWVVQLMSTVQEAIYFKSGALLDWSRISLERFKDKLLLKFKPNNGINS